MTRAARSTVVFGLLAACACATAPVQQGDAHEREIAVVVRRIDEARAQRGMRATEPPYQIAPDIQRLAEAWGRGEDPVHRLEDLGWQAVSRGGGGYT